MRGELLVHASAGMTKREYDDVVEFIDGDMLGIELPARADLERGGIVGAGTITGCVSDPASPWFFGPQGFLLRDAKPLPFVPFKGMLGFSDMPPDVLL